jgi:chaperonin GroES
MRLTALDGWEPYNDQVIVRRLVAADRTEAGIIVPEEGRERPQMGIVESLPGKHGALQLGDLVAFGKFAGVEFDIGASTPLLLMRELEVLARRPKNSFKLIYHGERLEKAHLADMVCADCATPVLDAERARAQDDQRKILGLGAGATGPDIFREIR